MNKKEAMEKANAILEYERGMGYIDAQCTLTRSDAQRIIKRYQYAFAFIIGIEIEFWVGDMRIEDQEAGRPTQPVDVALFGDNYYFSLYDMRVVVDNYDFWIEKYGNLFNLRQEILDWHDYAVKQKECGKTHINFFHWLNGCPRDAETSDLAADKRPAPEEKGGNNG